MKPLFPSRTLALATLLPLLAAIPLPATAADSTAGATATGNPRSGENANDVVISSKVRSAMSADDRFRDAQIEVQSVNGTVILTGTANADETRRAAEALASQVEGVTRVENRIATPSTRNTVKEDASRAAEKGEQVASDSWITTKVKSSLLSDSLTEGMNISVKTVKGVVTLSGSVDSKEKYERALQIAQKIEGVKSVDAAGLRIDRPE